MRPPRDLTPHERAAAVASLRTVGGIYDHVAAIVEADVSRPAGAVRDDLEALRLALLRLFVTAAYRPARRALRALARLVARFVRAAS